MTVPKVPETDKKLSPLVANLNPIILTIPPAAIDIFPEMVVFPVVPSSKANKFTPDFNVKFSAYVLGVIPIVSPDDAAAIAAVIV